MFEVFSFLSCEFLHDSYSRLLKHCDENGAFLRSLIVRYFCVCRRFDLSSVAVVNLKLWTSIGGVRGVLFTSKRGRDFRHAFSGTPVVPLIFECDDVLAEVGFWSDLLRDKRDLLKQASEVSF